MKLTLIHSTYSRFNNNFISKQIPGFVSSFLYQLNRIQGLTLSHVGWKQIFDNYNE